MSIFISQKNIIFSNGAGERMLKKNLSQCLKNKMEEYLEKYTYWFWFVIDEFIEIIKTSGIA